MTLEKLLVARLGDRLAPLSDDTTAHYRRCLRFYGRFLGRVPTVDDFDVDSLLDWAQAVVEDGKSPATANGQLKQLKALWSWGHSRQLVPIPLPRGLEVPEPRVIPDQWSGAELAALFAAAERTPGTIGPHWASDWMTALLWLAFNTGERAGALWQLTPDMIDGDRLEVPAIIRKESRVPMRWWLSPRCVEAVERVRCRARDRLFEGWADPHSVYRGEYRKLLERAGLAAGRRQGLQKMRRTVATRIATRGGDPGVWLGHAPRTVAAEHYCDRWAVQTAMRHVWPTDDFDEAPPRDGQRQLFAA